MNKRQHTPFMDHSLYTIMVPDMYEDIAKAWFDESEMPSFKDMVGFTTTQ